MTRLFEAKPFIVCEVGSNWETLDHCLESIRVAKECGADAVKFQLYDFESMYGLLPRLYDQKETEKEWSAKADLLELKGELPTEWLPKLKAKADECGIEFMCTAFSPELLAEVDPYVEVHKIASSDAAWPQMLEAVAKTGKPVLVSLGAKSDQEAHRLQRHLTYCGANRYVTLDCVAAYPADYAPIFPNFRVYEPFGWFRGISDHTLGYSNAVKAALNGATVIEKHFTAFPGLDTPDRPHSLTPKQFKRMVDIIRGREVESEETAMFLRHNRRLIAKKDIEPSEVLVYGENFGAYRCLHDDTNGASPFDWGLVQGRRARRAIARGDGIAVGDVE